MQFLKSNKYTPRWIIFLLDISISVLSVLMAFMIRFGFFLPERRWEEFYEVLPFVVLVRAITFFIFKSYSGVIRYTSAKDAERVVLVVSVGTLAFVLSNYISYFFVNGKYIIPFSIVIIDLLTTSFVMVSMRFIIKSLYHEVMNPRNRRTNVIILGADESGAITKRTIDRVPGLGKRVVAFIDNDKTRIGKKLEEVRIHPIEELSALLEKHAVSELIITKTQIGVDEKNDVVQKCIEHDVAVKRIPDSSRWINGDLSYNQIKNIRIEELLERPPIQLSNKAIRKDIVGKVLLITGAAGSIGSGLVRELVKYQPKKIILFDQAESPLYDLELELLEKLHFYNFESVLSDVTNYGKLKQVFDQYRPAIVYHAAAYKHVPMMEQNPAEAISTNVGGTVNLARLANEFGVDKFVMVSTDKAVNPTNIMGASKRIAEIFIQSFNNNAKTSFVTTRFGNVLGSNGSVIPRFKKQIKEGGPITITHSDVTRYFMTIPEACQLVLEASIMGEGGEIFLFDMGKSVRITDLAHKMVKISGLEVGKDIQIIFTGLRPGEKLHEELLTAKENTLPTYHEKIMKARVQHHEFSNIEPKIKELIQLAINADQFELVKYMKLIVPEFKSENSVFVRLDND
ncbi:MAG: nucleoside-diphosphate sugar epimerase/dehydratase [Salinivirgaceae bacterium]